MLARLTYRLVVVWRARNAATRRPRAAADYVARGREFTNFTYEFANLGDAIAFIAAVLPAPLEAVESVALELRRDAELRTSLAARVRSCPDREREPRSGKRILYYCIVRHERARVVVDTGTRDGLGSAVLARALERNAAEGAPSELLTFAVNARAGWLLNNASPCVTQHTGDIRETLREALAGRQLGVFVHDSLKTREHEANEFEDALRHRDDRIILITDQARATGVLAELSVREQGRHAAFREKPLRQVWPGNELGIAIFDRPRKEGARGIPGCRK